MSYTKSYVLLACAALPGLIGTGAAGQEAGHGQSQSVEEIIVTARRVKENLQDVPTAITAFTATDLKEQQILSFGDIGDSVPNLNLQTQFGEPATPFITIRGFSNGSLNPSVDSPIGLYVDDVYIGRAVGAAFDLADLEQLEVLRGPQGTLFGRNATGGALSFHTKGPTGVFDAHLETSFGNYDLKRVKATVDTPEINGLSARVTVLHTENTGYVKNSAAGHTYVLPDPFGTIKSADSFGENDETGVSAAVRYTGVDKLTLDYKFDYTHQIQSQLATQGLGFTSAEGFQQLLVSNQPNVPISSSRLGSVPLGFATPGSLDVLGHSITAAYDLTDSIALKDILAYRSMREDTGGNAIDGGTWVGTPLTAAFLGIPAGTPWTLISSIARRTQHQWSEEAQVIGTEDKFSWIAGIPGVELELTALPAPGLRLSVNYGYQRTPSNTNPVTGARIDSLYPSQNLALGAQYDTQPFYADAYASFRLDAVWTSDHPNLLATSTLPADLAIQQATTSPAEWMLNARVSMSDIPLGATRGKVSLWVANLLDKQELAFARDVFFPVGQFQPPRTFGVDLAVDF